MNDDILNERRAMLRGMGALALLAPALTAMRAGAEPVSSLPPDQQAMLAAMPADARKVHEDLMALPDLQMHGDETILMMLYPGFTALDLVAPYFFFASLMGAKVHLVTTEPTLAPVKSDLGLAIVPTVTMADAPAHADVLFIGGGTMGTLAVMQNPAVLDFIRSRAATASHVTSVCTGALVLGQAGLLKGKRATTHWAVHPELALFGATPVDARVVTDGKLTTGAGVSAGLDFAVAVVAALRGKGYAQALMLQAEYAPQPPFPGGTPATTPKAILEPMAAMQAPFVEQVRAVAKG